MNKIIFGGKVVSEPQFSHEVFDRKYYDFYMASARMSGAGDVVRCVVPEHIFKGITKDSYIEIEGSLASRRKLLDNQQMITDIYVYVTAINGYVMDINTCEIWGKLKTEPWIRKSKKDGKMIAEFVVESERHNFERFDKFPCIAWNEKALEAAELVDGDSVHIIGRLQSRLDRKYQRTVYEVSIPRNGELERWEM